MLTEDTHLSAAGGPRTTTLSHSSQRAADGDQGTSAAASTKLVLNTAQCRPTDLQAPKLPPEHCTKCFSRSGHSTAVLTFEFQVVLTELMEAPSAAHKKQLGSPECTDKVYSVPTHMHSLDTFKIYQSFTE